MRNSLSQQRHGERKLGFVYVVGAEHSEMVKIGFASDPRMRLAGLRSSNHAPLHLIYLRAGSPSDEAALLRRFRPLRVHGSWFRFERGNDLAGFISDAHADPFHALDIDDCERVA